MGYELVIGDRMYSSWSLRGWLLFGAFDLPVTVIANRMYQDSFQTLLRQYGPCRQVPVLRVSGADGDRLVWDTIAMAETLAEENPDAGLWPKDRALRGVARSLVAEMHSGFGALRGECSMNLRHQWQGFAVNDGVMADLARLDALWAYAREASGSETPWLFGDYTIADAFFAPVAGRIAGYGLPVSEMSQAYVMAHLNHPAFRQWRAMAFAENHIQPLYELTLNAGPWPGPASLAAEAISDGAAENATCPFSGKPVAADSLARLDGRIIGFCNPFCRDKSVADALAWPEIAALLDSRKS